MDNLEKLLAQWRAEPSIGGNVTKWHEQPASPGSFAPIPDELEPRLKTAFSELDYQQLYSHQAAAWQHAQAGKNFVVVTGTASGKTLCYNLPVLDALLRDPAGRALYFFPTKALAYDQNSGMSDWLDTLGVKGELTSAVYDGDTRTGDRPQIRKNARIILSNPDMLHFGILPYHTRWAEFFSNLRYVVIDEMHAYRGLFGSHVANVIRRLRRICSFYGSSPQFILASATIANPKELAERLIEQPVEVVDEDGAPKGPRSFLVYNPPIVNPDLGIRASVTQETVQLASDTLSADIQTIVFGRTRRNIEIILTNLRHAVVGQKQEQIRGYRSGYLRTERRSIEEGLRSGEVRGVIATTALELGVDIGGLDAAVLAGYPGTIAATLQQAGRAGRGDKRALVIMLLYSDPLEQYLARNPDFLFRGTPEQALVNPDNLLILVSHIRCAAFELPFKPGERFGTLDSDEVEEYLDVLTASGDLHKSGDKYFWMSDKYPALEVSLRGTGTDSVVLQSLEDGDWKLIGQIDIAGAHSLAHPEAIYIHEGETYFVDELNLEENIARMHPVEVDYYTVPIHKISLDLVEEHKSEVVSAGSKHFGEVIASDQVHRYEKVHWTMNEGPGGSELDLPPIKLNTQGYWFALDEETVDALREAGLWGNDPNDYGPNWEEQKKRVHERDNFTCRRCGTTEGDRVHDVHHLKPFRLFNSYKEANELDNLVTLCRSCHREAERGVRVRSGLAGLSFVLSRLAPLYLMCEPHNLGVDSDQASDLAEGRPAIAIYDNVPDGIGLSQRLYEIHDQLALRALELVSTCPCSDGCPSCVGPGGEEGRGSKQQTLAILKAMTGR